MEYPIFNCLSIVSMTSKEIAEAIDSPVKNVIRAFVFYQECKYVKGTQDFTRKSNPKVYRLTAKGKKKLKAMEKLKRDHPETWGKLGNA